MKPRPGRAARLGAVLPWAGLRGLLAGDDDVAAGDGGLDLVHQALQHVGGVHSLGRGEYDDVVHPGEGAEAVVGGEQPALHYRVAHAVVSSTGAPHHLHVRAEDFDLQARDFHLDSSCNCTVVSVWTAALEYYNTIN